MTRQSGYSSGSDSCKATYSSSRTWKRLRGSSLAAVGGRAASGHSALAIETSCRLFQTG
jgi:hypothetical protein